jgi:hypothetical protein
MKQKFQAGSLSQVDTIGIVFGTSKARKKMKIRRRIGRQQGRELLHDLGETVAEPEWRTTIHGRTDKVLPVRIGLASSMNVASKTLQHRFNSSGKRRLTRGCITDEIREARDDADVRLGPYLGKNIRKEL